MASGSVSVALRHASLPLSGGCPRRRSPASTGNRPRDREYRDAVSCSAGVRPGVSVEAGLAPCPGARWTGDAGRAVSIELVLAPGEFARVRHRRRARDRRRESIERIAGP